MCPAGFQRLRQFSVATTIAVALGCIAFGAISAQSADSVARRTAVRMVGVYDAATGEPIAGVQVRDAFTGTYAVTSATGTARLDFISYRGSAAFVQLQKLGYEPKTLVVSHDDTASVTETLDRVTTLAPVVTTERYRLDRDDGRWSGFERRCQATSVTCFRDADLAARPSANLADFLIHAPGTTIGACGGGASRSSQCGKVAMRSSVIPPSYCEPSIFIDGYLWNPHVGGSAIDMKPNEPARAPFTPTNVKAVEVYATDRPRPLRFEGDPLCGAIVVWTK